MKTCNRCWVAKPLSDFSKDAEKKDGLRPQCRDCRSVQRKSEYANNPHPHREKSNAFRAANPGYYDVYMRKWAEENKASIISRALAWNRTHKAKRAELSIRRYAAKTKATPKWADREKVQSFYDSADGLRMLTGEWYHVDHIVPLRGRNVCGLHVEFNLQILTASENSRKGNKYD